MRCQQGVGAGHSARAQVEQGTLSWIHSSPPELASQGFPRVVSGRTLSTTWSKNLRSSQTRNNLSFTPRVLSKRARSLRGERGLTQPALRERSVKNWRSGYQTGRFGVMDSMNLSKAFVLRITGYGMPVNVGCRVALRKLKASRHACFFNLMRSWPGMAIPTTMRINIKTVTAPRNPG